MEEGRVTVEYKDYADGNKIKVMTLEDDGVHPPFLLHILAQAGLCASGSSASGQSGARKEAGVLPSAARRDAGAERAAVIGRNQ